MRRIFSSLIFLSRTVCAFSHQEEIQKIDCEIVELEEMKRGFESRALKHDDMATYMQFEGRTALETRRHLRIAEDNRQKAALVQEEIDRLKEKKEALLK